MQGSAILELVERDAVLFAWVLPSACIEIETTGIGGIIGEIYELLSSDGRAFGSPH